MKLKSKQILMGAGLLLLGLLLGRSLRPAPDSHVKAAETMPLADATLWTCSMHPQIQQAEPGDCPICGMDLIPLVTDSNPDEGPRTLTLSESAKALAEIETTEVIRSFPEATVRLLGRLDVDETSVKSLTARFPARIDRLFVNYTGIPVNKGEHLADVYSPELLAAQREFLSSYQNSPDGSLTRAARQKLRLWDLLPEQIDEIVARGVPSDHFVLKSPISGVVMEKRVKEGDYVKTGDSLFRIVDLHQLWLYLDAYETDLPWLSYGQQVQFTVEAFPGNTFKGTIAFIQPEVNRKSRAVQVRVNVPNQDRKLKPGMFVKGEVKVRLAERGKVAPPELAGKWISPMHPEVIKDGPGACDVCGMDLVPASTLGYVRDEAQTAPLVIPASAVLRTGKRAVVYVEKPDRDRPVYEGREIELGPRAGDQYLVASGLLEGERVVTRGAFKIDSALQIQAKPSMMNPAEEKSVAAPQRTDENTVSGEEIAAALPVYFLMQTALAQDDLAGAKTQAEQMMALTGHAGLLPEILHRLLSAESLEGFRKPHFDQLSQLFIQAFETDPDLVDQPVHRMSCPMVYGDTGADWLQSSPELQNPYFGASMLHCGETKTIYREPQKTQNK